MSAFLHIQANGQNFQGVNQYSDYGGEDVSQLTQIISFYNDTAKGQTGASHLTSSHLSVGAYTIVKSVDHLSPMIAQAMAENHTVNAQIRFFDRDPQEGTPRESYQITLLGGRIVAVRTEIQYGAAEDLSMPLERVSIMPHTYRLTSLLGSTEYERSVSEAV